MSETKMIWDYSIFDWLFKSSPKRAFEYRKNCWKWEIPEEYLTEEEKTSKIDDLSDVLEENKETQAEEIKETPINNELEEKGENIEITRKELVELLKNAWIKFWWNSKTDVLVNLAIENNLI